MFTDLGMRTYLCGLTWEIEVVARHAQTSSQSHGMQVGAPRSWLETRRMCYVFTWTRWIECVPASFSDCHISDRILRDYQIALKKASVARSHPCSSLKLLNGTNLTETCDCLGCCSMCLSRAIQAWCYTTWSTGSATTDWSVCIIDCRLRYGNSDTTWRCERNVRFPNARRWFMYRHVCFNRDDLSLSIIRWSKGFHSPPPPLHEMVCKILSLILVYLAWYL